MRIACSLAIAAVLGCVPPGAPPMPARPPAASGVSFSRTWDAVIATLAEQGVTIQTIDRASGIVATGDVAVPYPESRDWSLCVNEGQSAAEFVRATILVRGDSAQATVAVTGVWWRTVGLTRQCTSKRRWEQMLEDRIAQRARTR